MVGRVRFLAIVTAVAVVVTGCTLDRRDRGATTTPAADGARWRPCPEVVTEITDRPAPANISFDCATIPVPRDWSAPGGQTFDIALMRVRAAGQRDRIGSLLVNPGGPGGSGIELATYLSVGLPVEVTRRFDIVGFDPRGVGRSSQVKCLSNADLDASFGYDPDPAGPAEFDGVVALSKRMADSCGAKYGETLKLFSTEQAARDMDAIRAAVGDQKITYLGYSYGTLLGATYAQLFPGNIRALVLDGAVDPRSDLVTGSESQAKGFERAFGNFVDWCRGNAGRCPIAADPRGAVTGEIESARRNPVTGPAGRRATAGWVFTAVVYAMYAQDLWSELGSAIDDLRDGDARGVFTLADRYAERNSSGGYSNLFDANSAVNCADSDEKVTVDQVRSLQSQWRERYPLFGAPLAIGLLTCAQWPGERDPYPTGPAKGAPPIVVVGTTGDPATPYEQTPKLADMLGVGVVLTWQGEGHTAYPETRCITEEINGYLLDLKVPEQGKTCPAG